MALKQFDWTQDAGSINISIPISGVSMKKIDIDLADLILKVNVKSNNYLKIFDFPFEVDYKNRENKTSYDDGILELYIKKKEEGQWESLTVQNISKEEIRQRREESYKRREESDAQLQSQRSDLKIKFDRLATEQQMRLETLERDTIEGRYKSEKERAEDELYGQLDERHAFKKEQKEIKENYDDDLEDIIPTKTVESEKREGDYVQEDDQKSLSTVQKQVIEPRKAGSVKVKFTEKMYPHLAAREQHLKEPPLPKTTQIQKNEKDDDIENPIWLKDKADEFYRNEDLLSAINAYSSAYRKKNDFIECLTNRSACFLRLFDYENCIIDCNAILEFLDKSTEKTDKENQLRLKTVLRKGIALAWKGCLEEAKELLSNQLQENSSLKESEKGIISDYIELVERRFKLNDLKKKADLELGRANIEEAKRIYEEILKEDSDHEIVRANLSLAYLKLKDYEKTIAHCDEVLQILKTFKSTTQIDMSQGKSWYEFRAFVVKVLLRRSSALEGIGKQEEALNDVEQALLFQSENAEAKKAQMRLKNLVARREIESIKEEANQFLKEKKADSALVKYNECLKKLQPTDLVPYLGILLNKCTCHLLLNEYEEIVSICLRGLNLLANNRQKILSFTDKNEKKEFNDKLKDYEIRFLVRRGNAYLKSKKFYHAKSDLEDALKLDPENAQIKLDLQALENALAEK